MKKFDPSKMKLTRYEQKIEDEIDQYVPVSKEENEKMRRSLEAFKKDTVLNMRINQNVLTCIKQKAAKLGVRYQTLISEILRKYAHA